MRAISYPSYNGDGRGGYKLMIPLERFTGILFRFLVRWCLDGGGFIRYIHQMNFECYIPTASTCPKEGKGFGKPCIEGV